MSTRTRRRRLKKQRAARRRREIQRKEKKRIQAVFDRVLGVKRWVSREFAIEAPIDLLKWHGVYGANYDVWEEI